MSKKKKKHGNQSVVRISPSWQEQLPRKRARVNGKGFSWSRESTSRHTDDRHWSHWSGTGQTSEGMTDGQTWNRCALVPGQHDMMSVKTPDTKLHNIVALETQFDNEGLHFIGVHEGRAPEQGYSHGHLYSCPVTARGRGSYGS